MATYYFRNTGDVNWGTATNWSLTDGGGADGAVPTSADDVFFTNNSGNCTLNTSARVCRSINFSTYANTITFSQTLTVSGNITLGASMGFSGSSQLICNATATLTSNGKEVSVPFRFAGTGVVFTLADNWIITGTINVGDTSSVNTSQTINGNTLFIRGNLTQLNDTVNRSVSGTANIVFDGTSTWTGGEPLNSGGFNFNINFNTSGTITINNHIRYNGNFTMTYTNGTVIVNGSAWSISSLATFNLGSNVILNGIIIVSNTTVLTLLSDLYCSGISFSTGTNIVCNGPGYFICRGGITLGGSITTRNMTGTSGIRLVESGTISINTLFALQLPLIIDATGTYTLAQNLPLFSTLSYISGTINYNNFAVVIRGNVTLDLNGYFIRDLEIGTTTTITITLNSDLVVNRSFINTNSTSATRATIRSDVANTSRKLTLVQGATQDLGFTNFTDIDAGDGKTIWVFRPTLTRTNNINSLTPPSTVSNTF